MATSALLGRFDVDATNEQLTVDSGNTVNLTQSAYFMSGYSGEGGQLVETLQAAIRASGPTDVSLSTVTLSLSTGFVTITLLDGGSSPVTADITFDDTPLGALLGFTGTQSGASAYTGTLQAQYCWFPTRPASDHPVLIGNVYSPRSNSRTFRALDGTVFSVVQSKLYDGEWRWSHIPKAIGPAVASVGAGESGYNGTFEAFYLDVIHRGEQVRIVTDDSSYASTDDYRTVVIMDDEGGEIGPLVPDYMDRTISTLDTYWDVTIPVCKQV